MNITVITESCFGTTRTLVDRLAAGARAEGAQVNVIDASFASTHLGADTDALVLAAPTHNRGLPSPHTRATARRLGGAGTTDSDRGVREWIADTEPRTDVQTVCMSTVSGPHSGSAASSAARELTRRGWPDARVIDFRVTGTPPTPTEGEGDRAEAVGRAIVTGHEWPAPPPTPHRHRVRRPWWKRSWFWLAVIVAISAWAMFWPNPNVGDRSKVPPALTSQQQAAAAHRTVTRQQLAAADGTRGTTWVAVDGVVYDLSGFDKWADGTHHGVRAGTDATQQFIRAPHARTFLQRAPVVGRLAG